MSAMVSQINRLFGSRSRKTSKLGVIGLCEGNPPVAGDFPSQRSSDAENVSIWWRHHDTVRAIFWITDIRSSIHHLTIVLQNLIPNIHQLIPLRYIHRSSECMYFDEDFIFWMNNDPSFFHHQSIYKQLRPSKCHSKQTPADLPYLLKLGRYVFWRRPPVRAILISLGLKPEYSGIARSIP